MVVVSPDREERLGRRRRSMKVLVVYFSQSENTEKIASAIYEEISLSNDAVLKKLDDVDPGLLNAYDQVFIGSPIHARGCSKNAGRC
jgi:flavodoxin I